MVTQEQVQDETYDISAGQLQRASDRVVQLQHRARRLGIQVAFGLEMVRTYMRTIRSETTGEEIGQEPRVEVRVIGEAPCLTGYTFVATVEHLEEGNVVRQVPGVLDEGALVAWREGLPLCEHCKTNRVRKDTFLLREDSTGRIFQVGRNCLVDFAGEGADLAGKLVSLLGLLRDFMGSLGSEECGGSGTERLIGLEYFLSYVAASIRTTGWLSRGKAREWGGLATADHAANCLADDERCVKGTACLLTSHNHIERTEKDHEEARLAVAFIEGLAEVENKNDYLHNLYVACASHALSHRHLGIAASAIQARRSDEERRIEREQRELARQERESLFLDEYLPGEIGERLRFVEVTLLETRDLESEWGVSRLHKFLAKGGYRVTWFASSESGMEIGQTYTVDFSIKKRDDRYGKTVVVTRVSTSKVKKGRKVA